ncbi:MAG: hypothetical protein AAGJ68_03805 [Pseudomonadota bacterium]
MRRFSLIIFSAAIALAGCSSSPRAAEDPRQMMLNLQPAINSVPSSALGPQVLDVGECGLFLWSKTDTTKFIFFSKALSGQALFAQDDTPLALTQIGAGGDIFGQFNTRLDFASRDNRQVILSLEPGEMLQGGQRIENGLLTLIDGEGWLTKLPVLGVRACQDE